MTKLICLAVGSLAGGFARYFLSESIYKNLGSSFPYGTLTVNGIGCLAIGFLSAIAGEKLGPNGKILLMTGFCGAFTTFSTFMLETNDLMTDGKWVGAFLNVALSLFIGFIAFWIGIRVGEMV